MIDRLLELIPYIFIATVLSTIILCFAVLILWRMIVRTIGDLVKLELSLECLIDVMIGRAQFKEQYRRWQYVKSKEIGE